MKAIVYDNYGLPDVLELREIENPTPNDDEILIKVHAASVNAIDYRFLLGTPFLVCIVAGGLLNPKYKVLGVDVAGQVEDVGGNVKRFQSGQKVLINGTSAVGTFAVQIAKSYETEVTGVCSTSNFDMVRSIGADQVIDYTQEDFAQNEGHYDNDVRYREEPYLFRLKARTKFPWYLCHNGMVSAISAPRAVGFNDWEPENGTYESHG